VYWHQRGEGLLRLPLPCSQLTLMDEIGGEPLSIRTDGDASLLPAGHKRYLKTELPEEELVRAFARAEIL
ncbi:MAG: hypothetical protein PUC47_11345, partial [Oscillospiraceae bacterium]|nr:hypothetical protein [Oscillospiraceae bacterium]